MGRMLELLKNREDARAILADTKDPPRVAAAEVITEWSLRPDEVPFIEVGPNHSVEGSPHVLSAPAAAPRREPAQQPAVRPPHAPIVQTLARSVLTAQALEARPVSVAFEPVRGPYEVGKVAAEILAYHQPEHAIARQYSTLATQLLASDAGKVLLFSGLRPSVGTSTVLLNLAVAASQQATRSVTLIDAQRLRPTLATKLGLRPLVFLQDVLSGALGLEQAILRSPIPRLAVLAATASHPEIVLGAEALTWLLATLKQRNDLILIDGPSLDESGDLSPLAPLADSLFVVTPQGEPASQARGLMQLVSRLGGRLRGLLHTQVVA